MTRRVAIIILAAGGSRRLGEPKQLLQFQGKSLLRHAAETALRTTCRPVIVVIGSHLDKMRDELKGLDVAIVENPHWQDGIASSIHAGLGHVGDVDGAVMMLCDQPFLTPEFIEQLVKNGPLVGADYGGSVGVPAFFGREFFDELNALEGDHGAKKILLRHNAIRIPCREALIDIDTKEEAARLPNQ